MADGIYAVGMHHLYRHDQDQDYVVQKGNANIGVSDTVVRLINELHKLYKRRPSKAYGKFDLDTINNPTSIHLRNYINGNTNFEALTLLLMSKLAKEAGTKAASTGGHVFFCHFEREKSQYFLVAIVTDKVSAALTRDENLRDVTHLDVDGFRFAGRVDLTGWVNDDSRYIGFLKGKGTVAEYFKAFLGCDTTIQSRVETTNLVSALKRFAEQKNFDAEEKDAFMSNALDFCDREARSDKPVDFTTLANALYPEAPEDLTDVLGDPELALSDGFVADRRALKGLVKFKRKTSDWSVEFERKALHTGNVRYNPEENSITLLNVPEDLQHELVEETKDG
nr:nucleoid-associated protein [uncultured Cohaesibacter sp.]